MATARPRSTCTSGYQPLHENAGAQRYRALWLPALVNGFFLGSIGPALEVLKAASVLEDDHLLRLVTHQRVTKLVGNLVWTVAAASSPTASTHPPLYVLILGSALASGAMAWCHQPWIIDLAITAQSFLYGFIDAGCYQVCYWELSRDKMAQRTVLAALGALYTVGAVLGPAFLAATGSMAFTFSLCALLALAGSPVLYHMLPVRPSADAEQPAKVDAGMALPLCPPSCDSLCCNVIAPWSGLCVALCCITGSEHSVASWLATIGVRTCGIDASTMSAMTSAFWLAILCGRLLWWWASSKRTVNVWAVLGTSMLMMFAGGLLLSGPRAGLVLGMPAAGSLLAGSLLVGLGAASGLPIIYALPGELHIRVTPLSLLAFNLSGSLGEAVAPIAVGHMLERGERHALGRLVCILMLLAVLTNVPLVTAFFSRGCRRLPRPQTLFLLSAALLTIAGLVSAIPSMVRVILERPGPVSCEVVIAEYRATASIPLIVREVSDCEVFVYSKSGSCTSIRAAHPDASLHCSELPNVGREQHTYAAHVAQRYTKLAERIIFVPAPVRRSQRLELLPAVLRMTTTTAASDGMRSVHVSKDRSFACASARYTGCVSWVPRRSLGLMHNTSTLDASGARSHAAACATAIGTAQVVRERGFSDDATNSCWCFAHRSCGAGRLPTPATPSPLGPWVEQLFGDDASRTLCRLPACNAGLFTSSRQNIRSRPRALYASIRDELAVSEAPESGYFMERLAALAYAQPTVNAGPPCFPAPNSSMCKVVSWQRKTRQ